MDLCLGWLSNVPKRQIELVPIWKVFQRHTGDMWLSSLDFEMPDLNWRVSLSLHSALDSRVVRLFTDNYSQPTEKRRRRGKKNKRTT